METEQRARDLIYMPSRQCCSVKDSARPSSPRRNGPPCSATASRRSSVRSQGQVKSGLRWKTGRALHDSGCVSGAYGCMEYREHGLHVQRLHDQVVLGMLPP